MTTPSEDSIAQSEAIAALAKHSWHLNLGSINPNTPLSISYSFLTEKPAYYLSASGAYALEQGHEIINTDTNNPFKELSQAQKDVFNLAKDAWAYVANITFTQTIGSIGQIAISTHTKLTWYFPPRF